MSASCLQWTKMARGDGKNKFYRHLKVSKEIINLIRYYNKVLKAKIYKNSNKSNHVSTGKITTG